MPADRPLTVTVVARLALGLLVIALGATACQASRAEITSGAEPTIPVRIDTPAATAPVPTTGPVPTVSVLTTAPVPTGRIPTKSAEGNPAMGPETVPADPTAEPAASGSTMPRSEPVESTPAPTAQPHGPCNVGPLAMPDPDRPVYRAALSVDPEAGTVTGTVAINFGPDLAIDELVVRLWPNGPRTASQGISLKLTRAGLATGDVAPEFVSPTLAMIPLPQTVHAGERIDVELEFELVVPVDLRSRVSAGPDYMRLGTILPILAWEPGVGWATDPPTSLFAEAVLSPVADYRVQINVPDGLTVLASGVETQDSIWTVEAARDFAISVGRFNPVESTAMAPDPVMVTVGVHETVEADADAYLAKVVDSLEQFSRRFGPYPWPSLSLAITPTLRGGIEFPTHIMQGPDSIGRTTSHEVGHMFFYSLVGNNQGVHPWLDEGITSYAEFTYEGTAANSYAIPAEGIGMATKPMTFWEEHSSSYYASVYSQTGFALQSLGSTDDVDCSLARYVADNAHGIATPEDFVAAFEPRFPNVVSQLGDLGVDLSE